MASFVHLHLHTQYSVLDGANKMKDVIRMAQAHGQEAVAITDHGVMHGAVELYSLASDAGIRPIIGCEVYITSGSRFDKTPKSQGGPSTHHLTLLCQNMEGYRNLCQLVTLGFSEGFYHKPRIDFELLSQFNKGLVCLSGCMASQLADCTKQGNEAAAIALIEQYRSVFDGRYYLEVQPHTFHEQQQHNQVLRDLATRMSLPMVATNDVHYPSADDHYAQEVLMCVSTGKLITDDSRIKHDESHLHFKSRDEMLFEMPDFEDALDMTVEIANSCELEFDFKTYHMPQFEPKGKGQTVDEFFEQEVREGLQERIDEYERRGTPIDQKTLEIYQARIAEEVDLIVKMGFPGYFLVVSDFIRWAKRNAIPVGPGRGSAAGSLIAYALFITEIDPIPHHLLFERFLNPERVSLPDIDVDFCINGRDKVIEYVSEAYGKDKVAQILTFGTLKAKAAIKDVGRALGLSYAETDRIAKLIPAPRQGFDYPIADALKMEPKLREYAAGGQGAELISLAQKLEGLTRHTSTHAAGLVISNRPIVEHLPLMVDRDGQIVTQFSMNWVEKIGLVKFDFLGLKTLSVLHEAVRLIKEVRGEEVDLNALPLNDKKTFRLISSARTIGVFQLESSGITDMVSRMKPSCFDDLVAILALYRPGPLDAGMVDHYINRKHGREPVRVLHPILKSILQDTYGIILYQEQIMQIARDMAGYSLGEADMLRRAMGKKKPEEMAKQRERFLSGAKEKQIDVAIATEVFDQMETFARYGFNKSHSVAYAMISYQTAYLKAHYPAEFLAALMTFEMNDTDKTLKNMNECREMGIPVSTPDVNLGQVGFTVVDKTIIFGLAAIKSVGSKAVEQILEEREKNGAFKSLFDFCRRVDSSLANRRLLENFVKAGAFDWCELSRAELLLRLEEVIKHAARIREQENSPQMGLFSVELEKIPDVFQVARPLLPESPVNIKLAMERDALGFYLSGHPLEKFSNELKRLGTLSVAELKSASDGSKVTVAGVITFLKLKNTKKGDRYATFTLEDLVGTIEVIVWPDTYIKVHEVLASEDPVILKGRLDVSDERRTIIASEIASAIVLRNKTAREAVITIPYKSFDDKKLVSLKELLEKYQGDLRVRLILRRPKHSETNIALDVSIAPSEELCNQVEQLFGFPALTYQ